MAASPVLPKLVGPAREAARGPAAHPGARHLRRRCEDRRDAASGLQAQSTSRTGRIRSIDTSAAEAVAGVEAVFTGAQIAEFLGPMPIGTPVPVAGPPRGGVGRRALRGRAGRRRRGAGPLRGARCGRRHQCRVRPAAGDRGPRAGADRGAGRAAPRLPEQRGRGAAAERHRRLAEGRRRYRDRPGVRGGRRRRLAADGQSPARTDLDRAAGRRGPLRAGQGRDDQSGRRPRTRTSCVRSSPRSPVSGRTRYGRLRRRWAAGSGRRSTSTARSTSPPR